MEGWSAVLNKEMYFDNNVGYFDNKCYTVYCVGGGGNGAPPLGESFDFGPRFGAGGGFVDKIIARMRRCADYLPNCGNEMCKIYFH